MNTNELTYLLNKPQTINEKQTIALEQVLQNFPYFQSVRALHLKGLFNQESFRYNYELKKTAAFTHDRTILFDFITSDEFKTLQKNHIDLQEEIINSITVSDVEIVIPEEIPEPFLIVSQENQDSENEIPTVVEAITEIQNTIEEELEIGKPLFFENNEKHSFNEWLQLTKFAPIEREIQEVNEKTEEKPTENTSDLSKKLDIIDKFIETNPKISPVKEIVKIPENISKSVEEPSHLMTETLAKIFLEQKKYTRAIQAYEILILKYPEKSSFFADRIENIKKLQQNNN